MAVETPTREIYAVTCSGIDIYDEIANVATNRTIVIHGSCYFILGYDGRPVPVEIDTSGENDIIYYICQYVLYD